MEKYVRDTICKKLELEVSLFQVKNPLELTEKDLKFFNSCLSDIPSFFFLKDVFSDISLCLVLDQAQLHFYFQGFLDLNKVQTNLENSFQHLKHQVSPTTFFHYEIKLSPSVKQNFTLSLTCGSGRS